MKLETGRRDKIFLAVALPVAAIAAYVFLWRNGAAQNAAELEKRCAALVEREDFDARRRTLSAQRDEAKKLLEEEKAKPAAESPFAGEPSLPFAERERRFIALLRECGLAVSRSGTPDRDFGKAAEALAAAGAVAAPVARAYAVEGEYPAVKRALDAIAAEKAAAIPAALEMKDGGRVRWILEVVL